MSKKSQTAIANPADLSTDLAAFEGYAEFADQDGFEDQDASHVLVPFLNLLQSNSPQVASPDSDFKAGQIYNNVTETAKSEMILVPAHTEHVYAEFAPRDSGGGFLGRYSPEDPVVKKAKAMATEWNRLVTDAGNELKETYQLYAVELEDGEPTNMVCVGFQSKKIAVYKRWNTRLRTTQVKMPNGRKIRPPLFAHQIVLKTVYETNSKGNYYNYAIVPSVDNNIKASLLPPESDAFLAARSLYEMLKSGAASADYDSAEGEGAPTGAAPF